MIIEVWSDVVCPWCYIGKRRLESALAEFPHEVEVVWRSFQLDPGAPAVPTETVAESLGRRYGGGAEGGARMIDNVEAVAAEEGLVYRLHSARRANTVDAHRVLHLALEQGGSTLQGAVKEALLAAYFTEARDIADHTELRAIGVAAGIDPERLDAVLDSAEYRDEVDADIERARAYGASGVPFFVIDQSYGVSGAQPADTFRQVLDRAWSAAHPALEVVGTGDVCGPDGCPV